MTGMEREQVDFDVLADWMAKKGFGTGQIIDAQQLTGGTQNILYRFSYCGREFVFRRPPWHLRPSSNQAMAREARVLKALATTDVPHPAFIASCDDAELLGAFFYLMEPIQGFNATEGMPALHSASPEIRRRMGFSYIESIAALGEVNYQAVGLADFGKVDGFLERQSTRWMSQLEGYSSHNKWPGLVEFPNVEKIPTWLEANLPAEFAPAVLHGDCHLANVMFRNDNGEVAALIDWELSTVGDPLVDLGWVLATWPESLGFLTFKIEPWDGFPALSELVKCYAENSSRNIDAIDWYCVLACFKLGTILEGTYARACDGKASMKTGEKLHQVTAKLFDRAHKIIASN